MAVNATAGQLAADLVARLSQDPKPRRRARHARAGRARRPESPQWLPRQPRRAQPPRAAARGQRRTASPWAPTSRPSRSKASAASARRPPSTCLPAPASPSWWAATARARAALPRASSCWSPASPTGSAQPAKVWQQGWRNLHHKPAAIDAEFLVEGEKGSTVLATRWTDEADLAAAETYAQIHGKPRMEPQSWDGRKPWPPTGPSCPTTSSARC